MSSEVRYDRQLLSRSCYSVPDNGDSFDLHAKEEFRQLATEFTTKANELERLSKARRAGEPVVARTRSFLLGENE